MRRPLRIILPWIGLTAVAAIAAVVVGYHVSLKPLGLHPREVQFAVAETQVFVDNQQSQLLSAGQNNYLEAENDAYNPQMAINLSQYLETQGPDAAMATAAGIPGQVVSASGPFTDQLNLSDTAPAGPQPLATPGLNPNYRLLVDVDGVRPMLSLYGQAPTEKAARAIVAAARSQLLAYMSRYERGRHLAEENRTVIRPLGGITGGVVDPGAMLQVLIGVFTIVFVAGGFLLVAFRRRAHRRANPEILLTSRADYADPDVDLWPHTRRPLPWAVAVFLVLLFLVPIDGILEPLTSLPLVPTLDRDLLVIMALYWLSALWKTRRAKRSTLRPRVEFTRVHAALFLFTAICFIGVALNGPQLATFQEVMPTVKKLVVLVSLCVFFVMMASSIRPGEVRPLLKFMVILGVLCGLGTILEHQTRFNIFYHFWEGILPVQLPAEMDVLDDIGRLGVVGPTSEPLELATLLALVLPMTIVFALDAKTRRERALYLVAMAILLAADFATARKTSVVAPGAALVTLIAYRPRPMLRGIAISIIPLFLAVHVLAPGQLGSVISELEPSHATAVNTDKVRVERYDAVRPDIMSHFLFGRGFEDYDPVKYRALDNQYLGLLIGTGVLGTAAFIGLLISVLTLAHPLIRGPDPERASLALILQACMVIVIVTCALFDTLSFDHVTYMTFMTAALVIALRRPSLSFGKRSESRLVAPRAASGLGLAEAESPLGQRRQPVPV